MQKITINENERALLLKEGKIKKMIGPGTTRLWAPWEYEIEYFDVNEVEMKSRYVDSLSKFYPEIVNQYFASVDVPDQKVAVVELDGKLFKAYGPGVKQLLWKVMNEVEIEYIDISSDFEIPKEKVALFSRRLNSKQVATFYVPESHRGLLYINSTLVKWVETGTYAFFKGENEVNMTMVDMRKQGLEISGQEILTKDRVSIRLNLEAIFRIFDPVKAITEVKDYRDFLYKSLQLALRKSVSSLNLDEILETKESLSSEVKKMVEEKLNELGIELEFAGVKDVILPGDMRAILNKVVLAQKEAQANTIKRREEVAATRSLLNTAKILEGNPTLMRLKELEAIEKITGGVEKLNIYGGISDLTKQILPFIEK